MSQESSSLTAWVVGRRCSPGPRNFSNVVLLMVQKPGKLTTRFGKFPIIFSKKKSNWESSPRIRGENKKKLKPTPSFQGSFHPQGPRVVVVWDFGSHHWVPLSLCHPSSPDQTLEWRPEPRWAPEVQPVGWSHIINGCFCFPLVGGIGSI